MLKNVKKNVNMLGGHHSGLVFFHSFS